MTCATSTSTATHRKLYTADKRSLDELIGLANETIAGHELSDSERYIYQVGN